MVFAEIKLQRQARLFGDTINKSLEHKYLFSQMSSASYDVSK